MAVTGLKTRWSFRNQILTLYYAFKDSRTPWYAKLTSLSSLIYLISPADILPDVIPLAGYIDDLFIVPFLVNLSTKLLPADIKRIAGERARRRSKKLTWVLIAAALAVAALMAVIFYSF
jgi:uncharacterized membrane protein YkvA (DUF1232 family)